MLKVFVDTNVLLDFFLCREGVDWARSILMKGYDNSCKLYVSSLTFSHLAYIMRKVAKGKALYEILETLMEMVEIISVDKDVISEAVTSMLQDQKQVDRLAEQVEDKKVIEQIKSEIKISSKKISSEKFKALA